jgi:hypothetical protein
MIAFLLDEHLPKWWRRVIVQQQGLKVVCIGDPAAPPLRSPDPLLLEWCEKHDYLLLTNNRKSMPQHLTDHVAQGRHVPGILVADPGMAIAEVVEELTLIAGASFPDEYLDQIRFLPLT